MGTKEKIGKITIQLLHHPFYLGHPNPNLKPSLTATTVKTNQKPPERNKEKKSGAKTTEFRGGGLVGKAGRSGGDFCYGLQLCDYVEWWLLVPIWDHRCNFSM